MERSQYARVVFVLLLLLVLYYVFQILRPFLHALAWAAILAIASRPLFEWLSRRLKRPGLAGVLTCVAITLLVIVPVIVVMILLAEQSVEAYNSLQSRINLRGMSRLEVLRGTGPYQWVLGKMQSLGMPEPDLRATLVRAVRAISQFLVGNSSVIFSGLTHFVFNFFVTLIALYYFLLHGPKVAGGISRLAPLRPEHEELINRTFKDMTAATLQAGLLTALVQGAAGGIVFLMFGVASPLLWGAVMAVLSLVPLVGTALVWVPAGIFFLLTGAVARGVAFLAVCALVVGSIDNFVKPFFIGRKTEINTLWLFLGVMGGIAYFGFLGFVLGPLLITILLAAVEILPTVLLKEAGEKLSSEV
jgi:predicted PurR-regulated permease PerM